MTLIVRRGYAVTDPKGALRDIDHGDGVNPYLHGIAGLLIRCWRALPEFQRLLDVGISRRGEFIETGAAPTLGRLRNPFSMAVAGDTLFVGNMFSDYVGVCGFRPASAIETGQQPSLMLDYFRSGVGPCSNLCLEQNVLFATSSARPVCGKAAIMSDINTGDVHIFGHADQIADGDQADIIVKGGLDFLVPLSIDAAIASMR